MTRLTESDLDNLELEIGQLNEELIKKTGVSLRRIGCNAAGVAESVLCDASHYNKIAVVPITTGQGLIGGFAESVSSIISYLGFECFVTRATDIAGIAEGIDRGGNILFAADDDQFVSLNCSKCKVVDNSLATGRGYAAALNIMSGGLAGKEVLIIGAGKVGAGSLGFLNEVGALPAVYDPDAAKVEFAQRVGKVRVETDLQRAVPEYKFIIDASPVADVLDLANLHLEAMIAAPGMPLGLTPKALRSFTGRTIHDPLHIGVATMLAMVIA